MTSALSIFRQRFPKVELQFTEDEPEDSFPALKRGDFDLAVVFDYPSFPIDFARDVDAELIYEESMRVALPPGHPLAAAKSVRIADLADDDWLCGELPSSCREQVLQLCRDAGFEPRISFQSEEYEVIKGFVAGGLGVTILPELAGGHPGIELRPVRGQKPVRRVWAVTRESEAALPRRRGDARRPARGVPDLPRRTAPAARCLSCTIYCRREAFGAGATPATCL